MLWLRLWRRVHSDVRIETNTCHQPSNSPAALPSTSSSPSHVCSPAYPATSSLHPGPDQACLSCRSTRQRGVFLFFVSFFFVFFVTSGLSHSTLAQLNKYPALTQFEKRTQVPKPYIAIGGVALIVILHLVNSLAAPVSNLVGFVIPAFLSFRAIESPSPGDDVQWLTYWIIFATFNFVESFALRVVLYYFSWYFPVKTLFLIWLQLPAFRVSHHVHWPQT